MLSYQVELPGRGTTRVWECAGPPGAATLVLLHGVAFTAELNWGSTLELLGRDFRVIAFDQRGHGHGISVGPRFRLEDCADDVAELAGTLGIRRCHVVGYSMGGMVAQLVYRRHPALLSGLVLCATARSVRESSMDDMAALGLPVLAAAMQWYPWSQALTAETVSAVVLGHIDDARLRARVHRQLRQTDLKTVLSAIQAVRAFTSDDWIGHIDVPTAVMVTTQDQIVPANRQRDLAATIPGAVVVEVDADHGVCVTAPKRFGRVLLDACRLVEPPARVRHHRHCRAPIYAGGDGVAGHSSMPPTGQADPSTAGVEGPTGGRRLATEPASRAQREDAAGPVSDR